MFPSFLPYLSHVSSSAFLSFILQFLKHSLPTFFIESEWFFCFVLFCFVIFFIFFLLLLLLASFSSILKLLYHVVENEQYGCHSSVLTAQI